MFSLVGFVFFDLVYVGAVINYAAQSEMNIYLLRAIRRMVVQKFYEDIDAGIKVLYHFSVKTTALYLISSLLICHCQCMWCYTVLSTYDIVIISCNYKLL